MREYLREHTNPPVFIGSAVVVLGFLVLGVVAPAAVNSVAQEVLAFISTNFEWLYIFGTTALIVFVLWLMFSRFGSIKLGPNDSKPEYSTMSWFAMLFTAGMGIGLVFYAVAEPVNHFANPPTGEGGTEAAASEAMTYTFFHWGFHPWAVYITLAASLGYFTFRRGLPLRPASALYPLLGERIYKWPGAVIDVLAVFGTLFGLATSLGIGGQQVGAGLDSLFGIPNTTTTQVAIICAITAVAAVSVMLGVDKGIRNLSLLNLWLAFGLMVFVFAFGPTRDIVNTLSANVGAYVQTLPRLGMETFPNGGEQAQGWQAGWTLFYWGWWISWSPFVGMFLARISYGRTLRSFVAGALFAPVGASMVWLTVFGDSALRQILSGDANGLQDTAINSPENSVYVLFEALPVGGILATLASLLVVIVVVLFFATSSDSGSLVVDILTNGGDPNPMWQQRLFWAVIEGVMAAVLLVASAASGENALVALQAASIAAGLPVLVLLIFMAVGLTKALRDEVIERPDIKNPSPMAGMRAFAERTRPPRAGDMQADKAEREEAASAGAASSAEQDGARADGQSRETVGN